MTKKSTSSLYLLASLNSLPLVSGQLPEVPPQPTRPVDHVQVTDVLECALIGTPFTA